MALVRWNPNRQTPAVPQGFNDDIECFLEDFFGVPSRPWYGRSTPSSRGAYTPRVDIVDTGKQVVLKAELPGVEREDLEITVVEGVVTIKGERKAAETSEDECYLCRESAGGVFERSIPLPDKVVSDGAEASLKNGVLTLTLPKAEPRESVKIKVN